MVLKRGEIPGQEFLDAVDGVPLPPARSVAPARRPAHANSAGRSCFQHRKQRTQMMCVEAGLYHQAPATGQTNFNRPAGHAQCRFPGFCNWSY